jgi:exoribonuclease R
LKKSDETRDDTFESASVLVPKVHNPEALLASTLRLIREEMQLPESFPPEVEREAHESVEALVLPDADLTSIPFVTIDPAGATDLDQALHLERAGDGYVVHYAIADVNSLVPGGGAVDTEARERGQTLYAPDGRIPLHPTVISEGAASLLEGQERGAFVWRFELDAAANVTATTLTRARVRSRHQYSYVQVQEQLDSGDSEALVLLREVGLKRVELERERGGASLNRPDEEVMFVDGRYTLERRRPLPVEQWNAQISLMTGMAAAGVMVAGGVGILRTMPAPFEKTLDLFRRQVDALGCPWPENMAYGEYLRELDQSDPRGLAAIHAASSLFRGAGYVAFDGAPPEHVAQAAVAAPYAHTTAPLRRLVDRFVLVTCYALLNGEPVPKWVREALPTLPKLMARAGGVESRLERASVDAIEAALLLPFVGQTFDVTVIGEREGGAVIQLVDPVVTATVEGAATPGHVVKVTLESADIATGAVRFTLAH